MSCKVDPYLAKSADAYQPEVVRPPIDVRVASTPSARVVSMAQPSVGRANWKADRKEREAQAVQEAMFQRDIQAFNRALPADDARRRELLLRSHALDNAFSNSALPVVRLILEWMPRELSRRSASQNGLALSSVARSWQNLDGRRRNGETLPNPPSAQDEIALLELLLNSGADPDGSRSHTSPLTFLAWMPESDETVAAAELLLRHGASIGSTCSGCGSPLSAAAEKQNVRLVQTMLRSRPANQDLLNHALLVTPLLGSNPIIPLLLERGADINLDPTQYGTRRFHPAWTVAGQAQSAEGRELMRLLIRYKVDPNRGVNETNSPLMQVMHDRELMKGLLDLGANPNYRNYSGDTPLMRAIRLPQQIFRAEGDTRPLAVIEPGLDPKVRAKSVQMLLAYGADPLLPDGKGTTLLALTHPDDGAIVNMLMQRGATLTMDQRALGDDFRRYRVPIGPVSWALVHNNDALAAGLLSRSAKLSQQDCGAMYYAAQTGSVETLSLLLSKKISARTVTDAEGHTPLMAAAEHGEVGAIRLLLDRRAARVNEATSLRVVMAGGHGPPVPVIDGGTTALMLAAAANRDGAVQELVRRGASVNMRDYHGNTALAYAWRFNADKARVALEANGAQR